MARRELTSEEKKSQAMSDAWEGILNVADLSDVIGLTASWTDGSAMQAEEDGRPELEAEFKAIADELRALETRLAAAEKKFFPGRG